MNWENWIIIVLSLQGLQGYKLGWRMLIHSTQTELILAACCLAAWPASVNIRQLDHCDRGITVLHGTTLLAITNLWHISQSLSIQVLSRYFQVSCFEVRNSYHNPISVPQGLWCSALVAHFHPHWRSNAMFHVTWCLSETSQLSRQQ